METAELGKVWKRTSEHLDNLTRVIQENPPGSDLYEYALRDFKEILTGWKDITNRIGDPEVDTAVDEMAKILKRIESKQSAKA